MNQSLELSALVTDFNNFISSWGSPEKSGYEDKAYPYVCIELGQLNSEDLKVTSQYIESRFKVEGKYTHLLPKVNMFKGELCLVVDRSLVTEFIIPKLSLS